VRSRVPESRELVLLNELLWILWIACSGYGLTHFCCFDVVEKWLRLFSVSKEIDCITCTCLGSFHDLAGFTLLTPSHLHVAHDVCQQRVHVLLVAVLPGGLQDVPGE